MIFLTIFVCLLSITIPSVTSQPCTSHADCPPNRPACLGAPNGTCVDASLFRSTPAIHKGGHPCLSGDDCDQVAPACLRVGSGHGVCATLDVHRMIPLGRSFAAAAGTQYSVSVTLDSDTRSQLLQAGYKLYVMKGVQVPGANSLNSNAGGTPVVWQTISDLFATNTISWTKSFGAFDSVTAVKEGATITQSNPFSVSLGQEIDIVDESGTGNIKALPGLSNGIRILNQAQRTFSVGLTQQIVGSGLSQPTCVFTLFHNFGVNLAPIEKVALVWGDNTRNDGTVVSQIFGPAVLIDLTQTQSQTISYTIAGGWDFAGKSWATDMGSSGDLRPFLIY